MWQASKRPVPLWLPVASQNAVVVLVSLSNDPRGSLLQGNQHHFGPLAEYQETSLISTALVRNLVF